MAPEIFQIMNEQGEIIAKKSFVKSIPLDDIEGIYKNIIKQRAYDDRMFTMQRQGKISFYMKGTGEEANTMGSAYALDIKDWVFTQYREQGVFIQRGESLKAMISQCFGNIDDATQGRQMPIHYTARHISMPTISSPLGTQISHTTGAAMAFKYRKEKQVAVCFFGDGTSAEGDFHAGVNFAGVYNAPAIFYCRNNKWAISTPSSVCTGGGLGTIAARAEGYGIAGELIDGNDIFAVIFTMREARKRALKGIPTLIEADTYRVGSHSTSDDTTKYRDEQGDEFQNWATKKDPATRLELFLEKNKRWNKGDREIIYKAYDTEILKLVKECEARPMPDATTMLDDVYTNIPRTLEIQRDEILLPAIAADEN